ncbi:hypothetical protein AB0C33_17595 [Nonomuraea sp. NPDC048881]|uniref:hypothetical protein n=1 Tax=Nonomuraea sp. NPDC048881 TaxID=3155030 RepID=UPI0033F7BA2C
MLPRPLSRGLRPLPVQTERPGGGPAARADRQGRPSGHDAGHERAPGSLTEQHELTPTGAVRPPAHRHHPLDTRPRPQPRLGPSKGPDRLNPPKG